MALNICIKIGLEVLYDLFTSFPRKVALNIVYTKSNNKYSFEQMTVQATGYLGPNHKNYFGRICTKHFLWVNQYAREDIWKHIENQTIFWPKTHRKLI